MKRSMADDSGPGLHSQDEDKWPKRLAYAQLGRCLKSTEIAHVVTFQAGLHARCTYFLTIHEKEGVLMA